MVSISLMLYLARQYHSNHGSFHLPLLSMVGRFWYTELGDDHIAVTGHGKCSAYRRCCLLFHEPVLLLLLDQCLNRKEAIEGDEIDRYQDNHPVQT
jgi:hypothetical protein